MKPEQLFVLASARGINLDLGRPPKKAVRRLGKGRGGSIREDGADTVTGRQTRSARAPEWSATDLGHAAAGMPERQWRTLCWFIGQEEPARAFLKYELITFALAERDAHGWPKSVKRGSCPAELRNGLRCSIQRCGDRYLEDLVELALIDVGEPHYFPSEAARARFFGISEPAWSRQFSRIYQPLLDQLRAWYRSGMGYLKRKLEDENTAQ